MTPICHGYQTAVIVYTHVCVAEFKICPPSSGSSSSATSSKAGSDCPKSKGQTFLLSVPMIRCFLDMKSVANGRGIEVMIGIAYLHWPLGGFAAR